MRACTPYIVTKGLETRGEQEGVAAWRMSRVTARGHLAAKSAKQRGVVHTSPMSSASLSRQLCASFGGSASAQDLSRFFPGCSPTISHTRRHGTKSGVSAPAGPRVRFVSTPRASHTARIGPSTLRGLTSAAARRRSTTFADGGIPSRGLPRPLDGFVRIP